MESPIQTEKICQVCQNVFLCSPVNCWCAELPLVMEIKPGEDCLCKNCLEKAIAKQTENKK